MSKFTAEEKRKCAEREIVQRKRVYPRLVAAGKMDQKVAAREIDIMQAIAFDYRAREEGERLL